MTTTNQAPAFSEDTLLDEAAANDATDVQGLTFPSDVEQASSATPIPNWLLMVIIGLVGWGGWYLGEYAGGWSALVYDESLAPGTQLAAPVPVEIDLMAMGERTYTRVCAACHQADGRGQAGLYPPLAESEWLINAPEVPIKIVLHGLAGPIDVGGNTYDGIMTPHAAMLDDNQIAGVLTWTRAQWGNQASTVDPELVAAIRADTSDRSEPWTAPELIDLLMVGADTDSAATTDAVAPVTAEDDTDSGEPAVVE